MVVRAYRCIDDILVAGRKTQRRAFFAKKSAQRLAFAPHAGLPRIALRIIRCRIFYWGKVAARVFTTPRLRQSNSAFDHCAALQVV